MSAPTPDGNETSDCQSHHDVINMCSDPFGQLEMSDNVPTIFDSETTIARDDSGVIVSEKRSDDIRPRVSQFAVTKHLDRCSELKRKGNLEERVHPLDALQSLNSKAESFVRRQREEEVPLEPFVSNPFLMNVCHLRALLNNLADVRD